MRSENMVILIGHVGADPEVRTARTGTKVASLSVATNRRFKDEERTDWHRVKCFEKTAEFVEQYVRKGDPVYVKGRIEYSTSEQDGVTRYWTDIVAHEINALGAREPTTPDSNRSWTDPERDF